MLFCKILGALLVGVSGVALAFFLNRRASSALAQADAWGVLLSRIKCEIECFSLPISEILSRVDGELLLRCGYVAERRPVSLSELLRGVRWVDGETERIVRRFASEFGRSYRGEQVGRCAYFLALLEERKKKLASELPSKRKLNSTLCLSVSLGLLILFT